MHFWPKFGNTDFNWWWLIARTSSKWGKFWLLSSIWPWSSRSIVPRSNRDLNQGLLHLWSKFGDSSLNSWWVIARTNWWLTDRHTRTHTRRQQQYGKNWPWKSKYKVMGDVKVESHNVGLTSYWLTSLSFHVNLASLVELRLFQNLTLKSKGQGHRWGHSSKSQLSRMTSYTIQGSILESTNSA